MKLSELQNLNAENIGSWPLPVKIFGALVVFALISFLGWHYDVQDLTTKLKAAEAKEVKLKGTFESKQTKAANLPALKQQLADIKESFGDLLKRLPDQTQVAELLVDISQQGLGAGLEFDLFKPGKEVPKDYYIELPIQIKVRGSYHEFGEFISGISDLPRIVTSHNVKIKPDGKSGMLSLEATAKTYRYVADDEEG